MHMSFGSRIPAALAALGLLAQQPLFVEGKLVFAHYMVSVPSRHYLHTQRIQTKLGGGGSPLCQQNASKQN